MGCYEFPGEVANFICFVAITGMSAPQVFSVLKLCVYF